MKYSRLETVQVLRDEEAETICVCQEGFTGDPDSKGKPFLVGFTALNTKCSVTDLNPDPDPSNPYVFWASLIRIRAH
jgi:hypothetical protein